MKVQRTRVSDTGHASWMVLDDDYIPVKPILVFLKFLEDIGRSPYTVRSYAHHLKLYWEYLHDKQLDWVNIDVAQLAGFIPWLRNPQPSSISADIYEAQRSDATINQILGAVHVYYDFQTRLKQVPEMHLYQFLRMPNRHYKPFLYGIAKTPPMKTRVVAVKPQQRRFKTLTSEQVQQLLDSCKHIRDRFLLALLYETGMRIGQALGLRHEDIKPEDNEIHIVPRDNNVNEARAKSRKSYVIPRIPERLMELYSNYLFTEFLELEVDHLPDYVFVNLWEGDIGHPMTYATVMSLIRRLRKKTSIPVIMRDKLGKVNPPAKQPRPFGVAPDGYNAALDLSHTALWRDPRG